MCVHFHIWLALWMMFYPIHFFGCARIPGTNVGLPSWQGIVPSKSIKMITIATNLILTRLVDIGEEFKKVNPAMAASLLEPLIDQDLTRLYPKKDRLVTPPIALGVAPDGRTAASFRSP